VGGVKIPENEMGSEKHPWTADDEKALNDAFVVEQPSVEALVEQFARVLFDRESEVEYVRGDEAEWDKAPEHSREFHRVTARLLLPALDSLTAALERAERERDAAMKGWPESSNVQVGFCLREKRCLELQQAEARAQKVEAALRECSDSFAEVEAAAYRWHERAQKAEAVVEAARRSLRVRPNEDAAVSQIHAMLRGALTAYDEPDGPVRRDAAA
jgi:hypothetical protein